MKYGKKLCAGIALAFSTVLPFASYAPVATATPATEVSQGDAFAVDFEKGLPDRFEPSDGWTNGMPFNCWWHKENVTVDDGIMSLCIDADGTQNQVPYSGGEFRSKKTYGYGRYEVCMKAIENDGVVSSFFTYTGPYDGDPWDEIDVEVLGKDPTKVQFNYFRNGKGGHEHMYDLGFNAADDFHTYAFEWHKDKIIWFVDGKEAYRIEGSDMPVTKGKIMMNAWPGKNVNEWLKEFNDSDIPLFAEYQWIKYTPFEE